MKKLFENKILVILLLTLVLVFNLYVSLKFVFRDKISIATTNLLTLEPLLYPKNRGNWY